MKSKILFPVLAVALLVMGILYGGDLFGKSQEEENKNSNIVAVTSKSLNKEIEKGVTLVDFWAPWCGPCRKMNPILEEVAAEYKDKVKIAKLNVDNDKRFAANQGIQSIPAMIVYKDGKEMTRVVGVVSKAELKKVLDQYIAAK